MSAWPVLVTLAALLFYFWTGLMVGNARRKYNVPAPATTGNLDFERVFRVQMNTLEWLPIFLVSLWIFGLRRTEPAGRAFSIFTSSLAIVIGTLFNLYTSHHFTYLWTLAAGISGGASESPFRSVV